jgi:hypothetical protein
MGIFYIYSMISIGYIFFIYIFSRYALQQGTLVFRKEVKVKDTLPIPDTYIWAKDICVHH